MEELLEKVPGKVFAYCDMKTRKALRHVCHSFALDIDVFTGLSVMIDDRYKQSLQLARCVKVNKIYMYSLRWKYNDAETKWIHCSEELDTVSHVSLNGFVCYQWIQECLTKLSNLKSLFIGGEALNSRLLQIYSRRQLVEFPHLESLEISSFPHHNSNNAASQSNTQKRGQREHFTSTPGYYPRHRVVGDIESGSNSNSVNTVADNIYYLLTSVYSPKLAYFRFSYDQDLYNTGFFSWRGEPLKDFLERHVSSLKNLTLDGEQNDQLDVPGGRHEFQVPSRLQHLYVSVVDRANHEGSSSLSRNPILPLLKSVMTMSLAQSTSLWREVLRKQTSLESLNCTIYAPWAWEYMSKVMKKCHRFLQVINIGCSWTDVSLPMDMDAVSQCIFLKKFAFSVMMDKTTGAGSSPERTNSNSKRLSPFREKRCRIKNLPSVLTCVFLESVFISGALCETQDLDVFTHLSHLSSLVLLYTGRMGEFGVNVGLVQEYLSIRTLNLLLVVEFYRQKHSMESYRLKRILRSRINNSSCPVIQHLVPWSDFGKFVYVGSVADVAFSSQMDSFE